MDERVRKFKLLFPEFDFSKYKYNGYNEKSLVICPIHGNLYLSPKDITNNKNKKFLCKYCKYDSEKINKEEAINKLKKLHPELDYSNTVINGSKEKIEIKCHIHGSFFVNYHNATRKNNKWSGCPKCSKRIKQNKDEILKILTSRYPKLDFSKFEYIRGNISNKEKSIVICPIHGEFLISYSNLINKKTVNGCPKCRENGYSKKEKEIVDFIKNNYNYIIEENNNKIIPSKKSPNRFMEIDIYLPEIKLGIEFNGIYWHNDSIAKSRGFNNKNEYHKYKTDECLKRGIKLLHIDENDWINNKEMVLNIIKENLK